MKKREFSVGCFQVLLCLKKCTICTICSHDSHVNTDLTDNTDVRLENFDIDVYRIIILEKSFWQ